MEHWWNDNGSIRPNNSVSPVPLLLGPANSRTVPQKEVPYKFVQDEFFPHIVMLIFTNNFIIYVQLFNRLSVIRGHMPKYSDQYYCISK